MMVRIVLIISTPDRGGPVSLGLGLLENLPQVEAPLPRQLRRRPPHVLAVIAGFLSCQFKLVKTCKTDESPEIQGDRGGHAPRLG